MTTPQWSLSSRAARFGFATPINAVTGATDLLTVGKLLAVAGIGRAGEATVGQVIASLGLTGLTAGALLFASGAAAVDKLPIGTAGRVLVAGASAPAWSDSGLSYASSVLTVAGSVPGTPAAGQVVIGGGVVKAGGAISGASLTATGGAAAAATIYKSATYGLTVQGAVGSSYDFGFLKPDGSAFLWYVPTGTANVVFTGGSVNQITTLNGAVQHLVRNTDAAGTSAEANIAVSNGASPTSDVSMGAWGASRAGSQFGTARANAAYIYSTAASITALVIGHTGSSAPVIIGSNNAAICTFATTGITAAQAIIFPNGTAAAPGIRTTTYAHGLYSVDATNIGVSVAGALGLKVTKPNGTTIGSVLTLQSPSAGELAYFLNSADNSAFILAGGQSSTMGQVRLYGSAHATKAGYVEFSRGTTVSAYFDGSGNLTVNTSTASTSTTTGALVVTGGVGVGGAGYFGGNLSVAGGALILGGKATFNVYGGNTAAVGGIAASGWENLEFYTCTSGGTSTKRGAFNNTGVLSINSTIDATTLNAASLLLAGGMATAAGKSILAGGKILSLGATHGIGYGTGAGGTVTQATSRTTGVTLNTVSGRIALFTAAGSATPTTFTVTCSAVAETDTVIVTDWSGAANTYIWKAKAANGSFDVTFWTTGGTASDAPGIHFNIIKGAIS